MTETVTQIYTGNFTNVFLVRGCTGCVLVDAGNPGKEELILKRLAEHGVEPGDLRLILITHGHTDHFGSAAALQERIGVPVAVHALDADALRQGIHQPDSLQATNRLLALLMRISALRQLAALDRAPPLEPDIVFDKEWRLDGYSVAGRVIPTPGHTPGSVSVLLDSREAIVGDVVMGQMMGLLHKPGPPPVAWDLEQNWESLRQLLALSPRIVYVSHGGPFENLSGLIRKQ
jgi:hydroxyacylglutathione hydrolase